MSQTKGLLLIPDISGFTRFVNNTALEHSAHIISELLEVLLNSNKIGLELIEIGGDALFLYKPGDPDSLEEILGQCESMFIVSLQPKWTKVT